MTAVLVIAGSDPTGGAGLEQDLRVLAVEGLHGFGAATALTVQDSREVRAVEPVDPELFVLRLRCVLEDLRPDAVKIGMLATAAHAAAVAGLLAALEPRVPVVLDPVLASSSGAALLDDAGRRVLIDRLLPRATVITPNRREAAILAGLGEETPIAALGARLLASCGVAVITGGDEGGDESVDRVFGVPGLEELRGPRRPGPSPHGTGCAFSSFLAAGLARGLDVSRALERAKGRVAAAVAGARVLGRPDGRPLLRIGGEA